MKVFKKEQKALYKSYKKRLTDLHEKLLQGAATPIEYFVTYLMMLRDKQLLSVPFNEELDSKDVNLASIITALKEYDKYKNSNHIRNSHNWRRQACYKRGKVILWHT